MQMVTQLTNGMNGVRPLSIYRDRAAPRQPWSTTKTGSGYIRSTTEYSKSTLKVKQKD